MNTSAQKTSFMNRLPVILFSCLIYLCIWNWSGFAFVYSNGELVGPDDFLRMSQVQAWMNGQGWFDLTAYKMVPPSGGDIHWSRLIDVPIAGLIYFLNLFVEFKNASYLAAIIWPLFLMLSTIVVWTLICDRFLENYLRWLPALFGILSISSINQFSVGRIDHHNIQILFFGLMVLGLVNRDRKWGDYLIGFAAAFSMSVGAETLIVIVLVLAIIGIEWASNADAQGKGIQRVGLSLIISSLILYVLNFHPSDYFNVRFDANSFFFLIAFIAIGLAFYLLGLLSPYVATNRFSKTLLLRLGLGVVSVTALLFVLSLKFPNYLGDPFSAMSNEAKVRWLNYVSEAKSLSIVLSDFPFHWLSTVGYYLFILLIGLVVLLNKQFRTTKVISLYLILLACVLGMIWQVRVIRTAAFLVVPFCTIFTMICWGYFKKKYETEKLFLYGFHSGVVMFQISIFWYIAGALFFPLQETKSVEQVTSNEAVMLSDKKIIRREEEHCIAEFDFSYLNTFAKTNIVSDLTTSTALMFHTKHAIVSGPYHRNERAILDTLDFMGASQAKAKAVAKKYSLTHMAFCTGKYANNSRDYAKLSVTDLLLNNAIPNWLEEVSPDGDRIRVFKITAN